MGIIYDNTPADCPPEEREWWTISHFGDPIIVNVVQRKGDPAPPMLPMRTKLSIHQRLWNRMGDSFWRIAMWLGSDPPRRWR